MVWRGRSARMPAALQKDAGTSARATLYCPYRFAATGTFTGSGGALGIVVTRPVVPVAEAGA